MSNKLDNDKYYTPVELAKKCIKTAESIIGFDNISDTIEPSAGNGSFSNNLDGHAYDIEPEADGIEKADFLKLNLKYLEGRLIIGNPPFGRSMNMAQKFFKKSVELGDYIAFILPISQLDNSRSLYEFDLIYSEDLGKQWYTDRELHCCFNIYARPLGGELNSKPISRLKDVTIVREDSKKFKDMDDFDLRMCYWGDGSAGKILRDGENYSGEYKIKINNPEIKDEVIEVLTDVDWHKRLKKIAMLKIQQFHIIELLQEKIDGIK